MARLGQKERGLPGVLLAFLFAMAGALAIFLPFLIVDKGFFLYCGDFNSQQIPFYGHVQEFLKTGGGTWDWTTDLGSSIVTSYSFYNLGSPFLWLTLPFPTSWMPYMMVPLFMLKFGAIAAMTCLYLQRYAKTRNMAVVCSLIFTFCGFNIYNVFFNHMLEPVAIFAFMLWALDAFIYDGKRGFFALAVGLSLLDNYFFFIGNVVFVLIYFAVKVASGEYKLKFSAFGVLVFEAVLGVGLGMVLALPSLFDLMGNPRTDNFASGLNLIIYWHVQQIPAILQSLIVPPDPPYLPNVFTEGAVKWTSMSAFLPVVSMAGAVAYLKSGKSKAVKRLLVISLVMALVPILNSSFYAFNASYYSRWYYMPLLIAALATMMALEDVYADLGFGVKAVAIATGLWAVLGLLPNQVEGEWKLGVAQHDGKFWLTWLTAMLGVALFAALVYFFRWNKRFATLLLSAVMGFSAFYAVVHISLGKFPQWEGDADYKAQQYDGSALLREALPEGGDFYRVDAYECHDNLGIWMNKSCLQTFNSTVNPSIMEFYPPLGVKRDVSSKPETSHYALRGLLSVRYTITPQENAEAFIEDPLGGAGWNYWDTVGPFVVYENENYLPLGFTYDRFIRMDTLDAIYEEDRAPMLMRAMGLDEDQRLDYQHLFAEEQEELYEAMGYDRYVQDVSARRATGSKETWADASGFGVRIDLERENLVFFAVPYDKGFTATVNGEETEVLKVSGGMMAVEAPAGENEIVFTYKTPGLGAGAAMSLASAGLLVLYLVGVTMMRRRLGQARRRKAAAAAVRAARLRRAEDGGVLPEGDGPDGEPGLGALTGAGKDDSEGPAGSEKVMAGESQEAMGRDAGATEGPDAAASGTMTGPDGAGTDAGAPRGEANVLRDGGKPDADGGKDPKGAPAGPEAQKDPQQAWLESILEAEEPPEEK